MQEYVLDNVWVLWAAWASAIALLITISCSSRARRSYPYNYIILGVFTLVFSVFVGVITSRSSNRAVGLSLAVTSATVFGAFIVAAFTKLDLTKFGGFLFAAFIGVIALAIIGIFWRNTCATPPSTLRSILHCALCSSDFSSWGPNPGHSSRAQSVRGGAVCHYPCNERISSQNILLTTNTVHAGWCSSSSQQ